MTKEEIKAQIRVFESIGGYSNQIELLERDLHKFKSITELQNESFREGYDKQVPSYVRVITQ